MHAYIFDMAVLSTNDQIPGSLLFAKGQSVVLLYLTEATRCMIMNLREAVLGRDLNGRGPQRTIPAVETQGPSCFKSQFSSMGPILSIAFSAITCKITFIKSLLCAAAERYIYTHQYCYPAYAGEVKKNFSNIMLTYPIVVGRLFLYLLSFGARKWTRSSTCHISSPVLTLANSNLEHYIQKAPDQHIQPHLRETVFSPC